MGGAQRERTAVFSNHYYPGARFEVIAQLQTNTTVEILRADEDPVPEISQPDEWTGHIIRYDIGDIRESGITTFLFTRGRRLSPTESGTIGDDASVLSSRLNLLSTSVTEQTGEGRQPLEEDESEETDDGGE